MSANPKKLARELKKLEQLEKERLHKEKMKERGPGLMKTYKKAIAAEAAAAAAAAERESSSEEEEENFSREFFRRQQLLPPPPPGDPVIPPAASDYQNRRINEQKLRMNNINVQVEKRPTSPLSDEDEYTMLPAGIEYTTNQKGGNRKKSTKKRKTKKRTTKRRNRRYKNKSNKRI